MLRIIAGFAIFCSLVVGTPAPLVDIGFPSVVAVAEAQYAQRFNPHGGVGTGGSDAAMHGVPHAQLHYEDQCRRYGGNSPMCMYGRRGRNHGHAIPHSRGHGYGHHGMRRGGGQQVLIFHHRRVVKVSQRSERHEGRGSATASYAPRAERPLPPLPAGFSWK